MSNDMYINNISNNITVFRDDLTNSVVESLFLNYKSKNTSAFDAACFYAPYIPLMSTSEIGGEEIEEIEEDGKWKFLLRRSFSSELPFCFSGEKALAAYNWVQMSVSPINYELSYVPDEMMHLKSRYGNLSESSYEHKHMVIEFFDQKDAALFKLMHL
jgi:hypothetical protein